MPRNWFKGFGEPKQPRDEPAAPQDAREGVEPPEVLDMEAEEATKRLQEAAAVSLTVEDLRSAIDLGPVRYRVPEQPWREGIKISVRALCPDDSEGA